MRQGNEKTDFFRIPHSAYVVYKIAGFLIPLLYTYWDREHIYVLRVGLLTPSDICYKSPSMYNPFVKHSSCHFETPGDLSVRTRSEI